MKRKVLGRGLDALLPRAPQGELFHLDLDRIRPNRFQPRAGFREEPLKELADSIRANGILQPLIVRPVGDTYELIAGERRWRAAQMAGLEKVPALVKSVTDERLLEMALIENIQREDLTPLETARGYQMLMEEYALTQEQVAQRVGKQRSSVANYVRLLKLPEIVRELLESGEIEMGHARALAGLDDPAQQEQLARKSAREKLSVRATERLVERLREGKSGNGRTARMRDPNVIAAEEKLRRSLGTSVRIFRGRKGGRIEIAYKSEEELDRIYSLLLEITS